MCLFCGELCVEAQSSLSLPDLWAREHLTHERELRFAAHPYTHPPTNAPTPTHTTHRATNFPEYMDYVRSTQAFVVVSALATVTSLVFLSLITIARPAPIWVSGRG